MGEKIMIVGYRDVDFTDDSQRRVMGRTYYFTQEGGTGVVGVTAGKAFINDRAMKDSDFLPVVGDECLVYFNRYGKVAGFSKITNSK